MKTARFIVVVLLACILALCGMPFAYAVPVSNEEKPAIDAQVMDAGAGKAYVEGEVLVSFKESVSAQEATEAVALADSVATEMVSPAEVSDAVPVVVEVAPDASVSQAIQELADNPIVEAVQPNYIYTLADDEPDVGEATDADTLVAQATVNDTYLARQWGLESVNAFEAWDIVRASGSVSVAVIDTGIDMDHPDLVNNIVAPYDVVNNDASPDDVSGHGTHVAGIVSAQSNNGIGVSGVSYNAKVMPLGVFYYNEHYDGENAKYITDTAWLTSAYNYFLSDADKDGKGDIAEQYNLKVVNMSLGGKGELSSDDALAKCIDRAAHQGIITICAAGNEKMDALYVPCDYETCVSVIALDEHMKKASYSNYGSTKDISAPGSSIYSTVDGGGYNYDSGTSMAAPIVSGVAALLYAYDSTLTVDEVKTALYTSAVDLGSSEYYGAGGVDAAAALATLAPPEPEPEETPEPPDPTPTIDDPTPPIDIEPNASVSYATHVQNTGWQAFVSEGKMAGTSGRSLRLEGIKVKLSSDLSGSIKYRTHVQNIGWQNFVSDGAMSGTEGRSLRLEGIEINLTGDVANAFDVYYRVHAQDVGWMGWAKNGESAGTAGYSRRLEGIQVLLVSKGGAAPSSVGGIASSVPNAFLSATEGASCTVDGNVNYNTHVQNIGWQSFVSDGAMAGTSGRSYRLEGIHIELGGDADIVSGSIQYRTHVQNLGWQKFVSNGAMSGTYGRSLRLEAIEIKLTGEVANRYDVYYRTHIQDVGWAGWAANGSPSGTAGYSRRLEGIQIVLVAKGGSAPRNVGGIASAVSWAFHNANG